MEAGLREVPPHHPWELRRKPVRPDYLIGMTALPLSKRRYDRHAQFKDTERLPPFDKALEVCDAKWPRPPLIRLAAAGYTRRTTVVTRAETKCVPCFPPVPLSALLLEKGVSP